MPLDPIVIDIAQALRSYYSEDTAEPYAEEFITLRSEQAGYVVFQLVRNYTRGVGFLKDPLTGVWTVDEALQAVIVSAASRYYATRGQGTMTMQEFSPAELAVLHQFRKRAG